MPYPVDPECQSVLGLLPDLDVADATAAPDGADLDLVVSRRGGLSHRGSAVVWFDGCSGAFAQAHVSRPTGAEGTDAIRRALARMGEG